MLTSKPLTCRHLAMTAILTAGLMGFEKEKPLAIKDPKKPVPSLSADQRKELGITDDIPASLKEAIDSLDAAEELKAALGPEIVGRYLKVKTC